MVRAARWPALLLLAAIALSGCGGDDKELPSDGDRGAITAAIEDLGTSARERDGARICDELFTENLRISVEKASKKTCAKEVGDNIFGSDTSFEVGDIDVDGTTATVTVTDQRDQRSDLVLFKENGAWRIARIG